MAPEIGILVIHGIGNQDETFANGLINKVNGLLKKIGVDSGAVAWEPAYWANLLNKKEDDLLKNLSKDNPLRWTCIRRFVINVLADAVAYQRDQEEPQDMYRLIHAKIRGSLGNLRTKLGGEDKPLIVIAHSLGSVIASNFIWDEQHMEEKGRTSLGAHPFERMETLASLVTFGSNIPLFTLALPDGPTPIKFPPNGLHDNLKANAKWLNFYDPDDVLGYPLKPIYGEVVAEDIAINAGSWLTSWNPISHIEYWTDDDFTNRVAKLIRDVVDAGRTVPKTLAAEAEI